MINIKIIKITISTILFLLIHFYTTPSFSQEAWCYGLRLDFFQSKLVNIDKENYSGYMLSDPYYTQVNNSGLSPTIFTEKELNSRWNLNGGVGFIMHKSKFHFDYQNSFNWDIKSTLFIELYYLTIPIGVRYKVFNKGNHALLLGGSLINQICLCAKSNFEEIIFEQIIAPVFGRTYVLSSRADISYVLTLKNKSRLSLATFISRDLTNNIAPFGRLGFVSENLKKSKYLYYGISISYSL